MPLAEARDCMFHWEHWLNSHIGTDEDYCFPETGEIAQGVCSRTTMARALSIPACEFNLSPSYWRGAHVVSLGGQGRRECSVSRGSGVQ